MITIRYIYHDCFIVSTDSANLIFDYWKTSDDKPADTFLSLLDSGKPLYVFVSHHHKDHLNPEIFSWGKFFPNIHFIISRDVARFCRHYLMPDSHCKGVKPQEGSVIALRKDEQWSDSLIRVCAFDSTDIGNSYSIEIDGYTIFHAGDLNAWVWIDESTQEEIDEALEKYRAILIKIANRYKTLDYVMFPVDPRLGTQFWLGASMFVREIDCRHFFPMHFALGETRQQHKEFEKSACDFSLYANQKRGYYIALTTPYQQFANYGEDNH